MTTPFPKSSRHLRQRHLMERKTPWTTWTYKTLMHLKVLSDEIMCQVFPLTPKGPARAWFRRLKSESTVGFLDQSNRFINHFISAWSCRKPVTYLFNVKQEREKSLRNYITRFNREALQVGDIDDKVVLTTLMGGLQPSRFLFSLCKSPLNTLEELMMKAQKHMNVEDAMATRKGTYKESQLETKRRKRVDGPGGSS